MTFNQQVEQVVSRFPTAESIVEYCRAKSIKGVPNKCHRCLLAELFNTQMPGDRHAIQKEPDLADNCCTIWTIQKSLSISKDKTCDQDAFAFAFLPKHFAEVAENFDCHKYPDLIAQK